MRGLKRFFVINFIFCTLYVIYAVFVISTPSGYRTFFTAEKAFAEEVDITERYNCVLYVANPDYEEVWKRVDGVKEVSILHDRYLVIVPIDYPKIDRIIFEEYEWKLFSEDDMTEEKIEYIGEKAESEIKKEDVK